MIHNNIISKPHKTCLSAYPQRRYNHPNEVAKSPLTLQLPTTPPPTSQTAPPTAKPLTHDTSLQLPTPPRIQPKALNLYQVWLRVVPVKWRVLLAMAPFTLLFGLLEVLFHQLGWELWKFDSLLVNEAEAIPTNAWRCGWESWPA